MVEGSILRETVYLTITSPQDGETFDTSTITVEWDTNIDQTTHKFNIYLNGEKIDSTRMTSYELTGLPDGDHTVEIYPEYDPVTE